MINLSTFWKASVREIKEALRKLREYIADLILNPDEVEHLDIVTLSKIKRAVEKQVESKCDD